MWIVYAFIANVCWSVSDILNSILVRHYHRNPLLLAWVQCIFDCSFFLLLGFFFDVSTTWTLPFLLAGISTYAAFLTFFYVLDRVDVSVMNAAWAFMAIVISIGGMFLFGEVWSLQQTIGVLLVLGGVFFLSYWHQHVSVGRTIGLLTLLGVLYAPLFLTQKAALLAGESVLATFYWPFFFSKICGLFYPLSRKTSRQNIRDACTSLRSSFILFSIIATTCSIAGMYFITIAFKIGLVSLVSMTENAQPFIAIFLAWIVSRIMPSIAPRELLTAQSVQIKIVSFIIVFTGLALLALG